MPIPDPIPADLSVQLEALCARFGRLSDLMTQKLLRSMDSVRLEDEDSVLDRLNRAEKRGTIDSAAEWREIRELRNQIAYEYVIGDLRELFEALIRLTPVLLRTVEQLMPDCPPRTGDTEPEVEPDRH